MQKLFALMAAIAMLVAPAFMSVSMAKAAGADHHAQMTQTGDCAPASGEDQDQASEMACCGATCMAVAITHSAVPMATPLHGKVQITRLQAFRTGTPAELATPPPRNA